eukprot:scaffold634044_cov44-Prasinocladus_malaysianus.AAC.2
MHKKVDRVKCLELSERHPSVSHKLCVNCKMMATEADVPWFGIGEDGAEIVRGSEIPHESANPIPNGTGHGSNIEK